jgi:hypothetical protein
MKFEIGQKFFSSGLPRRIARVVQTFNDPHQAWIEIRDENGKPERGALIASDQVGRDWMTIDPGKPASGW